MKNRASIFYERITDFSMTDEEKEYYNGLIKEDTEDHKLKLKKHNRQGLAQNWVKVISYQGKYYPYLHESFHPDRFQINDSTMVTYWMEGPEPAIVLSIKKITDRQYEIRTKSSNHSQLPNEGSWKTDDTIKIYFIDKKKEIAVFVQREYDDYSYNLMIDADRIKKYPIIVTHNAHHRTKEFKGADSIDFKKILAENNFSIQN